MKNKPTVFGTVAGMTALIGVFPLLITLGLAHFAPILGSFVLAAIHLGLTAVGAWIFVAWFGD